MTDKININLQPLGKMLKVVPGTPLIDVLNEFGVEFPCGGKGSCGNCSVKILDGHLDTSIEQQEKLNKLKLGEEWRLACYCKADEDLTLEVSQFDHIILADNSDFEFEPQKGYGLAIDLGTTTLVVQLVDLKTGHVLDSLSDVNPQSKFGSDLISRIQGCLDGNQELMQELVRNRIGKMIGSMLANHPVAITRVNLVGNTVMHHIFSGLDVNPLSAYPFESGHLSMQQFQSADLSWNLPATARIRFYPSIGSFVGSDILAGIAATQIYKQEEYSILIDLGTNGEIVAGNKEHILCASTAAGPAFEGAKISQGMPAATGAISSVKFEEGKLAHHVIGNVKPRGICGSGLIDIIAVLLENEQIGMFGELNSGEDRIELAPGIFLTQQDIREFQLAKAAIATGIQILLNKLRITLDNVANVYIAGGFGNFLDVENVIRTGLIECAPGKIVKFGNTALLGAKMFLFEDTGTVNEILEKTDHVNLEGDPSFQDVYIEKMMLV